MHNYKESLMGVLGHNGEYKPRFGLWINTTPECQEAIKGILAEGFDCDVVLKWSASPREVVSLSEYYSRWSPGKETKTCELDGSEDYIREVFFPQWVTLKPRKYERV
jgi:hypothetical protein